MNHFTAIILAAGKGTRMKSERPKVLHEVAGRAMLDHVLAAAEEAGASRRLVVIGYGGERVAQAVAGRAETVVQEEQLGTGHALLASYKALRDFSGTIMVLCGDTPLLRAETLHQFYQAHQASGAKATVLTAILDDPSGYGRIIRDDFGGVCRIVEQKDATESERSVREINTGIYCFEAPLVFDVLAGVGSNNAQGEYYLTDVLGDLVARGQSVRAVVVGDAEEVMGINARVQLAEAEAVLKRRVLLALMENGVTVVDPASTFVEPTVKIDCDTILYPFTWLGGNTVIGKDCRIGPNTRLTNVQVGDKTEIHFSYAHDCTVGSDVKVGPFAHLRPDTVLADKVKVGNFVEVKNSNVGEGSKLPHLSYIGDTDMGAGVNMGCGTITVNYDGKIKHRTTIADGAFVGCNANLVAPVTVGKDAYIAAGSTITKEVPEGALGVARARQNNLEGWAKKRS